MTAYPVSNIELAQIGNSNNETACTALKLPNSRAISDHGMLSLAKFHNLTHLDLSNCEFLSDPTAAIIHRAMPQLTYLDISKTAITDVGIVEMLQYCIHIETLKIKDTQHLKDSGMLAVHKLCKVQKNLRNVDFSGSRCFSNEALISLLADGGIVLDEINLTRCTQVNDLGMTGMCNPKNCKVLKISKCCIHDETMSWIAEGCRKLEELDVQVS